MAQGRVASGGTSSSALTESMPCASRMAPRLIPETGPARRAAMSVERTIELPLLVCVSCDTRFVTAWRHLHRHGAAAVEMERYSGRNNGHTGTYVRMYIRMHDFLYVCITDLYTSHVPPPRAAVRGLPCRAMKAGRRGDYSGIEAARTRKLEGKCMNAFRQPMRLCLNNRRLCCFKQFAKTAPSLIKVRLTCGDARTV